MSLKIKFLILVYVRSASKGVRCINDENLRFSTLNLYANEGFGGFEQYFYQDSPQFRYDDFGASIIITGCDPWTLYE